MLWLSFFEEEGAVDFVIDRTENMFLRVDRISLTSKGIVDDEIERCSPLLDFIRLFTTLFPGDQLILTRSKIILERIDPVKKIFNRCLVQGFVMIDFFSCGYFLRKSFYKPASGQPCPLKLK